jgi:hypothetical protein
VADKHPYLSGSGPLFQIVNQLRKTFPAGGVTADTLKKLGLASNNEIYVINILRFIKIIDDEGKKTEDAAKVLNQHDDAAFQKAFEVLVKNAYLDLFSIHGDDAWTLDGNALIQYFRSTDDTSAVVGRRQATTFQALSALSGHAGAPATRTSPAKKAQVGKPFTKKVTKGRDAPTPSLKREPSTETPKGGGGRAHSRCRSYGASRDQPSSGWRSGNVRPHLQEHSREPDRW